MAGIIKAAGSLPSALDGAAHAFPFDDLGSAYVGQVRSEAARIIAEARAEAARIKAKATEDGKQAAIKAVEAQLRARLDQQVVGAISAIEQAARGIAQARQAWQQHWERAAVELATAIAQRICRRELSREPGITLEWVREALELAAGGDAVTLRLNPADHATLGQRIDELAKRLAALGPLQVVADEAVSAGGCRVDTAFGTIDQRLEVQLARITEELLE